MIRKLFVVLVIIHFLSYTLKAQSFMQGLGANISILSAKINNQYESYTFTMVVTHFSYFPRVNLTESENSSVSIGVPLGVGIGILNNAGAGTAGGVAWGFDLPVALDYNMGCKSTPENEDNFGGYFGAGFGYMYTGWTDAGETSHANTYGPMVRGGIRFGSGQGRWHTTVGLFYKLGLESQKYKTFGFNVLMDL